MCSRGAILVRDLVAALRALGCRPARTTRSSHEVWGTPGGATFPIVVNHRSTAVGLRVLATARRVLRAEGLELP